MSVQSISLTVPKIKKRRWGKPKPGESLKMLAAGSLAFAKAYSSVEKLEHELEAEYQRDKQSEPEGAVARWRNKGGKLLLNKYVLLFIVALNTIDCALVLGELILDLHHVKDVLTKSESTAETFLKQLNDKYPNQFVNVGKSEIEDAYHRIIDAQMTWVDSNSSASGGGASVAHFSGNRTAFVADHSATTQVYSREKNLSDDRLSLPPAPIKSEYSIADDKNHPPRHSPTKRHIAQGLTGNTNVTTAAVSAHAPPDEDHSQEQLIGHAFHNASMGICVILVIWVSLKILCFGRAFLERKLEVFDAGIIFLSFIVDLVFLEGLTAYTIQEFVFILAFMLPWRVIRVTNSLVVTVRDHEHFRLKLLYAQKKKVEGENKTIRLDRDNYKEQVDALKKLCLSEGIDDWKIFQSLARQQVHPGKGAMGSFASLAFGAIGNAKSASIWSVLATPKMRRGKSMENVANLRVCRENHYAKKRHNKNKVLSFLGSSTDFFKGKMTRHGQDLSVDSDPGIPYATTKCELHDNHELRRKKKRLERGETIDTISTDTSFDGVDGGADMKNCSCGEEHEEEDEDEYSRQDTADSSLFEESSNGSQSSETGKVTMRRIPNGDHHNHAMHFSVEESPIIHRPASLTPLSSTSLQVPNSVHIVNQS